jgi:hypothetical protein
MCIQKKNARAHVLMRCSRCMFFFVDIKKNKNAYNPFLCESRFILAKKTLCTRTLQCLQAQAAQDTWCVHALH